MKNRLITIFLSATLLSSTALADRVVAKYKGGEVTEDQIMAQFGPALNMQPENKGKKFSELDKNLQEMLVKGYINSKLLEKEADKMKIRDTEDFKTKIKAAETQILQQEVIERILKDKVTDAMVDAEYTTMVNNLKGKEEVKTAHILVDTEEKAKEIKKKLNKGSTNFAELVKEFSKDESSKATGGEIGYVVKGQLVPEYEEKAFTLKKNDISDPVKTQFGWHIIKMLDKRTVQVPTKEQALPSIRNKLSREIVEKYFGDLAAAADITFPLDKK